MNFRSSQKALFCIFLLLCCTSTLLAQQKYWVLFTDKPDCGFDPHAYFDQKALERRALQGLPLSDQTDWPVSEVYLSQLVAEVDSVKQITRWLNGACVLATEAQMETVRSWSFVRETQLIDSQVSLATLPGELNEPGEFLPAQRDLAAQQLKRMGGNALRKAGFDGSGMRVAIFDAGFPTVNTNPAFAHIRKANRIIKTWDFVQDFDFVYGANGHGTMVMSNIGGMIDTVRIGLATGAEFLLARTERASREPFSEEENWLAAAEWADKNGADIINSSLGYSKQRYFTMDMDGHTSFVALAARIAARKGILVVNSAGNEGTNSWGTIVTPGDVDSVLTVGGIEPSTDFHIGFSSYGPTSDMRMKPNVCAFGRAVVSSKVSVTESQGTSFSSPLVAGFAACAWQAKRNLTNMALFAEIERSADLYPYFDYAHGFGVPQGDYFTAPKPEAVPTFELVAEGKRLNVKINDQFFEAPKTEFESVEDAVEQELETGPYLYYHIENDEGWLSKYYVIKVINPKPLTLDTDDFEVGEILRFHYKGYTLTHTF